jgi:hypothetical protein
MTERHNALQLRLMEAIRKCRNIKETDICNNQRMKFDSHKELKDINVSPFSLLRPDMFFWAKVKTEEKGIEIHKMFVIEINVPFGRDNGNSDTLKEAHLRKQGNTWG